MQGLNHDERLIWLLQTILKEQVPLPHSGNCSMIELDKLQVAPHLDDSDQAGCFSILDEVIENKDFYRKHNMLNYKPSYSFDYSRTKSGHDIAVFCDFTNDFINTYLIDQLGVKSNTGKATWDSAKRTFKFGEEKMKIGESIKGSFGYYACTLLFGGEVQLEESDKIVSIQDDIEENYEIGTFVGIVRLEELIREINHIEYTKPVKESRTLYDAILKINKRAKETLGLEIFHLSTESVKVIV
jgi:hypothetical protein